ncbi:hypothetical protein OJF2_38960 [Aquisphaera giovannonii]|uniref:Putative zinc-finger domain-containing protein n=1 Tax=Aquisphaera giovannonii TaxID=406548 RepID=A0A5B9W591_9BACT|nr:zf-HC2 domain-containing protein [Aquisphaera giovannonii]QEH35345.1 hypothetical protein OJF2_38960 [Aquisphaera giovannonii]
MTRRGHRRRRGGILSILTLRCADASELISERLDGPLPLADRLAAGGHLLVCAACRRFARQVRFLHEACARRPAPGPDLDAEAPDVLSADARARILDALRDAQGGGPDGAGATPP